MSLKNLFAKMQETAKGAETPEEMAKALNDFNSDLVKEIDNLTDEQKKEIDDLKKALKQKDDDVQTLNSTVKNQGDKIEELVKAESTSPNAKNAIKEIKDLHSTLKEAFKNGEIGKEFTVKTDTVMKAYIATKADTLTTSVANFTRGVEDPTVTRIANRRLTAYQAIPSKPRVPANAGGTYRYLDQDSGTSVRAAAQVAEGAPHPESTIAWVKRSLDLKKTGEQIPYSDEFAYDFQDLMQELVWWLTTNVNIQVDDQIINGDGTGENYTGILTSIPAFVPVASGITDANIFDLACVVSEDITSTEGSKYMPDLIFLNSADIVSTDLELKKDADNNYIPVMQMLEMKGFTVVENNSLAANTMILGDSRYAHIIEDGIVTVKTGLYSGTDAIDGIERILVSTRKNLLIKNLEQTGWREVTSISAALTTLAT